MARAKRLLVVNVTLQGNDWDFDEKVSFAGRDFRLVRRGTKGDLQAAGDLVWKWSLAGRRHRGDGDPAGPGRRVFDGDVHEIRRVLRTTGRVPVLDGSMLADVLQGVGHPAGPGPDAGLLRQRPDGGPRWQQPQPDREGAPRVHPEYRLPRCHQAHRRPARAGLEPGPQPRGQARYGVLAADAGPHQDRAEAPAQWVSEQLARRAAKDADVIVGTFTG